MEEKIRYLSKPVFRFRKWGRKSYAVFSSLGKQVSIGHLKKSIIESSMLKSVSCRLACIDTNNKAIADEICEEDYESDISSCIDILFQLNLIVPSVKLKISDKQIISLSQIDIAIT